VGYRVGFLDAYAGVSIQLAFMRSGLGKRDRAGVGDGLSHRHHKTGSATDAKQKNLLLSSSCEKMGRGNRIAGHASEFGI
jgi:hypothetical protein